MTGKIVGAEVSPALWSLPVFFTSELFTSPSGAVSSSETRALALKQESLNSDSTTY